MKVSELTEEQRAEFTEQFYYIADDRLNDINFERPWGAPWLWCDYECLDESVTSASMLATEFWMDYKDQIEKILDQEEKYKYQIEYPCCGGHGCRTCYMTE